MFAGLGVSTMFRILAASRFLPLLLVIVAFTSNASAEWKEKVLYSFQGGSDGQSPTGSLVFDKVGNLYGATNEGGSVCPPPGCGTIFRLRPASGGMWTETILYEFNGTQGSRPVGGLIQDSDGDLYGTAAYGGGGQCTLFGDIVGCGVVYELLPPTVNGGKWTYTVLYNFQGGKDGDFPYGALVLDRLGSLYGATQFGGGRGTTCNAYFGGNCGTVFKLSPPAEKGGAWVEQVLYSFAGGQAGKADGDGANPDGGLVLNDQSGDVYGTTYFGGNESGDCDGGSGGTGCGIVFELVPPARATVAPEPVSPANEAGAWKENILFRFDGTGGAQPGAGVIFGQDTNLYGTTIYGGYEGDGIAFELLKPPGNTKSWTEKVLYLFGGKGTGLEPSAGLLLGTGGALYGTSLGGEMPRGVVFRLNPEGDAEGWEATVLYNFTGAPDGNHPIASLITDGSESLYGTTEYGGSGGACQGGCGTVFEVTP
jgi:uncharacterized repeat protein (TIGR03803 family)